MSRDKAYTWEQRKLGEVFEQTVEYVNPKLENIELWSVTVESGLTPKTERYNREALVKKENKFKLVHPGDVVYNPMNMTIGAVGMNQHSDSIAVSGYYVTMRLRENFNGFYFFEWLSSDRAMNLFRNHATGSLIEKQRVQFPTLSNIGTYVPAFLEQKNIGHFFQRLDKLITLHQRKYDALKSMKKTLLSKMFPKNGEDVPEIRFKEFTDAWEQRKLGTAINVKSGKDYKHLDEGDVPVYGTGGYMLSVSEALENTRDAIGIGRKGTIDKPFVLKAPFWTVDTLFYCIPKENNSLIFLYSLFQSINWKLYDESTGVPSLSKTAIDGVTINLTSEDEQFSIGECFESVDNLITLHQRKLEELKNMKKSLLQQMFV